MTPNHRGKIGIELSSDPSTTARANGGGCDMVDPY